MNSGADATEANNRGAWQMVAAMGLLVVNDGLVKRVSDHLPSGQILLIRGLFATAAALAILWTARGPHPWHRMLRPIIAWRVALEFAAALASVAALSRLPVVTVSATMMTAPLIVVVVSLRTAPAQHRLARLGLCIIGFTGACLVLQPGGSGGNPGWWVALVLAVMVAMRDLVTRRIPDTVSSEQLALALTLAVTAGGAMLAWTQGWSPIGIRDAVALAAAACATTLGNLLLIRACRGTDLAVVAPYRYSVVLWAFLAGMLFWDHRPDALSIAGSILIVFAGVLALRHPRT